MDDHAITFNTLPALGAPLEGGAFAGLITLPDGTHNAVVLLPVQSGDLTWPRACEWARQHGGALPTRLMAALLFANIRDQLQPGWHWTADKQRASHAWSCQFDNGYQEYYIKSFACSAVAVRLIPLSHCTPKKGDLQRLESAALLALGLLWMTKRDNDKVQAAFKTLRDALGGQKALRQGIEAAIDAGYEADHPPGADWWAGKK